MIAEALDLWRAKAIRWDVAKVLLSSEQDALIPREIASTCGRDASNVKDAAEELALLKLLDRVPPPAQPGRGRKARWAYRLAEGQRDLLAPHLAASDQTAIIRGLSLVFADVREPEALAEVLSQSDNLRGARWFARSEGSPQEYLIAFGGDEAISAATRLVTALRAADVDARRSYLSEVAPIERLVSQAQEEIRASSAQRIRQRTRRTA